MTRAAAGLVAVLGAAQPARADPPAKPVETPDETSHGRLGLVAELAVRTGPRVDGGTATTFGVEVGGLLYVPDVPRLGLGVGVGWFAYGTAQNGKTSTLYEYLWLAPRVRYALSARTGVDVHAGIGLDGQVRAMAAGAGYRWTVIRFDLQLVLARDIVALDDSDVAPDEDNTSVQVGLTTLFDEGWYSLVALGGVAVLGLVAFAADPPR